MTRIARWEGWRILSALLLVALLITAWTARNAQADHQPANKFAAAGAAMDDIDEGTEKVILSETLKVPSTHDLQISASLECSILTYLNSSGSDQAGAEEVDNAEGRVDVWVTIDGTRVPVQTGDIDEDEAGVQSDDGEVTFCNREYERFIGDREQDEDGEDEEAAGGDGVDEERDFIATRNANAFNWFALDVGTVYDRPYNGNNIVTIELWAQYERTTDRECTATTGPLPNPGAGSGPADQDTCSDAYVGKRTLVAEPTNASVHENVEPADTPSEPGDQQPAPTPSPAACPTYPVCVEPLKE